MNAVSSTWNPQTKLCDHVEYFLKISHFQTAVIQKGNGFSQQTFIIRLQPIFLLIRFANSITPNYPVEYGSGRLQVNCHVLVITILQTTTMPSKKKQNDISTHFVYRSDTIKNKCEEKPVVNHIHCMVVQTIMA